MLGKLTAPGRRWAGLRDVGTLLDDTDAGMFTAALALANWHFCIPAARGAATPTVVVQAGWVRAAARLRRRALPAHGPGGDHGVVDDEDRLLLGRQATWPAKRYSTLAGFVEPGESLEAAVRREVAEEAGVVGRRGRVPGQPALAVPVVADARLPRPRGGDRRWRWTAWRSRTRGGGRARSSRRTCASGELLLPPRVSIARAPDRGLVRGAVGEAEVNRPG